MSDFVQAYIDGNADKMMEILETRFPDAPRNTMAAAAFFLVLKVKDAEELAAIEPRLGELVDKIKAVWVENKW